MLCGNLASMVALQWLPLLGVAVIDCHVAVCRNDPPVVTSGDDLQQWMCRAHNAVNRSLGKPTFNCDVAAARWTPLDCDESNSCDMTLGRRR